MRFVCLFVFCTIYLNIRINARVVTNVNTEIEKVIQQYIGPLKQLSASFPNHEVQMQIDFVHPPKLATKLKTQQVTLKGVNYKPRPKYKYPEYKNYRRAAPVASAKPKPAQTATSPHKVPTTTATTTTTTAKEPETTTTAKTPAKTPSHEHKKTPLTLEDLMKALEEFGKKFFTSTSTTSAPPTETQSQESSNSHLHGIIQRQLSKLVSGDNLQLSPNDKRVKKLSKMREPLHLTKTVKLPVHDDDIEWVRIKVPK